MTHKSYIDHKWILSSSVHVAYISGSTGDEDKINNSSTGSNTLVRHAGGDTEGFQIRGHDILRNTKDPSLHRK